MRVWKPISDELRALGGDGKGRTLSVIAMGWGLLIGTRMILPVIIPFLQSDFGISLTVAGLLVTVVWFFGSIGQLPSGILADRYSERLLMAISTLSVASALVLVVLAPDSMILFVATAIWGLGHSLYPVPRITLLASLYDARLGSALGVTMAAGDVGQTALPPIAAVFAAAVAWQAGLGFVVPFLLLIGVALLLTRRGEASQSRLSDASSLQDTVEAIKQLTDPRVGYITLVLLFYIFIWQSFTSFYPTYLTNTKELSPALASLLFGFFFAVGVIVKPIAGAAYDRVGVRASLVGIYLPAVVGLFALPMIESPWLLVGVTASISTMLGSGAVTQSYLAESFSKETKGTGLGVVRTLTASIAATGPLVFGTLGDHGYFDEGYVALAVILAGIIVLTLWMPETES